MINITITTRACWLQLSKNEFYFVNIMFLPKIPQSPPPTTQLSSISSLGRRVSRLIIQAEPSTNNYLYEYFKIGTNAKAQCCVLACSILSEGTKRITQEKTI